MGGWAGWLGGGNSTNPYSNMTKTARYIVEWVKCARDAHNLNITHMGLWNEADVSIEVSVQYLKALRPAMDDAGFQHIKIILPDGDIADAAAALAKDPIAKGAT